MQVDNSFASQSIIKSNKYRMRLCDADTELLNLINKDSEKGKREENLTKDSGKEKHEETFVNKFSPVSTSQKIISVDNIKKIKKRKRISGSKRNSNSPTPKSRRKKCESIVINSENSFPSIYKLVEMIESLKLDNMSLKNITPNINWTSEPRSIIQFPYYTYLHPKEALVATTLRLTPFHYLSAKYVIISSARMAMKKSLPFRKSHAQKLLRIDVNKTSKLWEWFVQTKWIQNYEKKCK